MHIQCLWNIINAFGSLFYSNLNTEAIPHAPKAAASLSHQQPTI